MGGGGREGVAAPGVPGMSYGPVNDSAAIETQVDGKSNTTSYAEDALGRVASVTDALNRVTTYTYDATGAVLTATDPQNQVTTNAYDAAGALTSTTYSNAATHSAVRAYSAAGLPATLVDGTGTTTFTYDSLGRLTNQTAPGGSVGYGYNLRSQVTTMTYPNNKVVTQGYENDGALTTSTDWSGKTRAMEPFDPAARAAQDPVTAVPGAMPHVWRDVYWSARSRRPWLSDLLVRCSFGSTCRST
jgi:YD repeat-containing protein